MLHTVEGGSVPRVFHANYLLSQQVKTLLDQCKFQLLAPVFISVGLGLKYLRKCCKRIGAFCSWNEPIGWSVIALHSQYWMATENILWSSSFICDYCLHLWERGRVWYYNRWPEEQLCSGAAAEEMWRKISHLQQDHEQPIRDERIDGQNQASVHRQ